jgi:hypothetical protein
MTRHPGARCVARTGAAIGWLAAVLALAVDATAADFGSRGGPAPGNVAAITARLRDDPYDLELLISFGTSKRGSAGHVALALRDTAAGDDPVYTANFYADRSREHASGYYTNDLMLRVPKAEYLFGTASTLGDTAEFGLDFGEIYKRSVVGVRVYGVPAAEKEALATFFARVNDDYRKRARNTDYHRGEIRYDYVRLNCAKTIGAAFRYGAGYGDLEVRSGPLLPGRKIAAALSSNVPTEMAMNLIEAWHARGFRMDTVLYRKYPRSTWIDPRDDSGVPFKDLPDRFPSVLSRDFRRDEGHYRTYENLYAMYLLFNLGRYVVQVNHATKLLEIVPGGKALPYAEAAALAARNARSDSENFRRGVPFEPMGTRIGSAPPG